MALHTFLRALLPDRLQQHFCLTTPLSLTVALTEAERAEAFLTAQSPPQQVAASRVMWPLQPKVCYHCGQRGQLVWHCLVSVPIEWQQHVGHLGNIRGVNFECSVGGVCCRTLIDTGTQQRNPPGWKVADMRHASVTSVNIEIVTRTVLSVFCGIWPVSASCGTCCGLCTVLSGLYFSLTTLTTIYIKNKKIIKVSPHRAQKHTDAVFLLTKVVKCGLVT